MGCGDCANSLETAKARAERAELGWTRAASALLAIAESCELFAAVASKATSTPEDVIAFVTELTSHLDTYNNVSRETEEAHGVESKQAVKQENLALATARSEKDFIQATAQVGRQKAIRLGMALQRHRRV